MPPPYPLSDSFDAAAYPGVDPTGTADSTMGLIAALNDAANDPQRRPVYLRAGTYLVSQPLPLQQGVRFYGALPVGEIAKTLNGEYGTIIKASAAWSNVAGYSNPGMIVLDNGSGNIYNATIQNIFLDGTAGPASGLNGIAANAATQTLHIIVERVGILGVSGIGISAPKGGNNPDGWHVINTIVEKCGGVGIDYEGNDGEFINTHVQNGNATGSTAQDGWVIRGSNNRFIGCRADSASGNGWNIASTTGGGFMSANTLIGCGTEGNTQNGIKCTNVSATGKTLNNPVILIGCDFDGDGVNTANAGGGGYASVWVEGANTVFLLGCNLVVDTNLVSGGAPQYALATATIGTGPGVPLVIQARGGYWVSNSAALFNDSASSKVIDLDVYTVTGGIPTNNTIPGAVPVATPSTPAANATITNTTGTRVTVYIAGGTGVAVSVNGSATGLAAGVFHLKPADTISLGNYSVAPTTWLWQAA